MSVKQTSRRSNGSAEEEICVCSYCGKSVYYTDHQAYSKHLKDIF